MFTEEERDDSIEWWTYDSHSGDYHFAIEKTTLQKIKEWYEVRNLVLEVLDPIRQWTRFELILWLLPEEDRNKQSERIVEEKDIDKKQVTIKIADDVLDILLGREKDDWYEQRYWTMWRKMIFYVNYSIYKAMLEEELRQCKNKQENGCQCNDDPC